MSLIQTINVPEDALCTSLLLTGGGVVVYLYVYIRYNIYKGKRYLSKVEQDVMNILKEADARISNLREYYKNGSQETLEKRLMNVKFSTFFKFVKKAEEAANIEPNSNWIRKQFLELAKILALESAITWGKVSINAMMQGSYPKSLPELVKEYFPLKRKIYS